MDDPKDEKGVQVPTLNSELQRAREGFAELGRLLRRFGEDLNRKLGGK